ncbi:MAG: hypothetical protein KBB52_03080, partial [Candidatus Omnitrophica bacterium]|nr:hypothetical protein [Candidatus Omnitrophota bacterium]
NKKESAIIYYKDIINRYPDCSYVEMAKTRIEELKTGKARPKIVTAEAPKGGLFGLWGAKASEAPVVAAPEVTGAEPAVETSQAAPSQEPVKKGWTPFSFGKKDGKAKEIKSAEATAPMPKKWSWTPFNFGKKDSAEKTSESKPSGQEAPAPQVQSEPVDSSMAVGSVPAADHTSQTEASAGAAPQVPGQASPQPIQPGVSPSIAEATSPAPASQISTAQKEIAPKKEAPCQQASPYAPKKKGWNLVDILGFGSDAPKPAKKTAEKPKGPDAPVTAEPLSNASSPASSTDDPNIDKDDYIY